MINRTIELPLKSSGPCLITDITDSSADTSPPRGLHPQDQWRISTASPWSTPTRAISTGS